MQIETKKLLQFTKTLKVLYVEDNADTREALGELLHYFFDSLIVGVDGVDGLQKFEENRFDIVISDIRMPKMNGIEMAKAIRLKSPNTPIIMATAHQESEYLLECIKCSVDGYLLKPINVNQLQEAILKVTNKMYCDRETEKYELHLQELVDERTQELKSVHEELISMVNRDSMTGLYNRRYFNEISNTLLQIAKRENNDFTVLMVDIDHFKIINDTYGHLVGDIVLENVATIMLSSTRESDIVVRFGGEEFVILLPGTNLKGASFIAEKIRKSIEDDVVVVKNGNIVKFTGSIGVAAYDKHSDIDELIHHVDVAMYDAKRSGRNKIVLYNKEPS